MTAHETGRKPKPDRATIVPRDRDGFISPPSLEALEVPPGIMEAAEEIAASSDVVGLERSKLELLVRTVLHGMRQNLSPYPTPETLPAKILHQQDKPMTFSRSPYWPLTPGSSITYQVFETTNDYLPNSGHLNVSSRTPAPVNGIQTIHCVAVPTLEPAVYLVTTVPSQPEVTLESIRDFYIPHGNCLLNGLWNTGTQRKFWGEANVQKPYQALLFDNPVVGEYLPKLSCKINSFQDEMAAPEWLFTYDYRTLYKGPRGGHDDVVMTSMVENTDKPVASHVPHNYAFARGIGPVDYWRAYLQDGSWKGYEWYATAWSGQ